MKVEQIILTPITTPRYPDPTVARRFYHGRYGYDYVYLGDTTWNALCEIAHERACTVDELCKDIELNFAPGDPFAPAARRYVVRYIADIPDNIELPANFRVLTELLAARRKEKTARRAIPDAERAETSNTGEAFDKKLAAYKQRMKAHTDAIKRNLARFIEKTTHSADGSPVTTALLELGFERQLDLHGEEDAKDLIDRAFRRVVKERRGPLQ
jgi:hypothetical protein